MSDYDAIRDELAALRREVAQLRAERSAPAAAPEPEPVSRRALLGKVAGLAVAGAGMAALSARPAEAAVGGNFILGAGNDSVGEGSSLHNVSAESTLDVYNGGTGSALFVDITSTTSTAPAGIFRTNNLGSCIDAAHLNNSNSEPVIVATSTSSNTAVKGVGWPGVHGEDSNGGGSGVLGQSTSGIGVYGYTDSGRGVYGYANAGTAMWAYASAGYGVRAYGATAPLLLEPAGTVGPPTGGAHDKGAIYVDSAGVIWQCVATGTPGTWAKPGFNAVPATRVINAVTIGSGLTTSATVTGIAGVPSTAKAVAVAVNATANANTYLTVYATGATRPVLANVHVAPQYTWDTTTIAPVGTGGKVTVYNRTGSAKVYMYVLGYFL